MTPYQYKLYTGMLRLFRGYQTGGASWTPITASGGTISTAPTFTAGTALTLYIVEASLIRKQITLPAVGIYAAPWWGLGGMTLDIDPGVILQSAASPTLGFQVDGVADTSQGFPVFPLVPAQVPTVAAGALAGQPMGLLLTLTYAA
jgi:hypothetical protein